jgi:(1->4)-alpha-D-glucan 1-alpha-D-glucosylmutase
VARLTCTLCGGDDAAWSPTLWGKTRVPCAVEAAGGRRFRRWRNWLTGTDHAVAAGDDASLELAAVFAAAGGLPFAILVSEAETAA